MANKSQIKKKKIILSGYVVLPSKYADNMPDHVILSGIENTGHPELPRKGINLLYGFTGAVKELSEIQARYRKDEASTLIYANIEAQLQAVDRNPIRLEDIKDTKFVHLSRVNKEVIGRIEDIYREQMVREGMTSKQIESVSWRRGNFIAERPELLELVYNDEMFEHLEIVAYPVTDNRGRKIFRATLRSVDHVTKAELIGAPEVEVRINLR